MQIKKLRMQSISLQGVGFSDLTCS